MKKSNITDIVREELDSKPFIKEALLSGIVNYSALARELLPIVKEKNKRTTQEAVLIAIQRYLKDLKGEKPSEAIRKVLAGSTLSMKGDIVDMSLARKQSVIKVIHEVLKDIKWDEGEVLFLIQGATEIGVITDRKNMSKIIDQLDRMDIFSMKTDFASISMKEPIEGAETPGLYSIRFDALSKNGINVYDVVSTPREVILILDKKDAPKAYQILDGIIEKARQN